MGSRRIRSGRIVVIVAALATLAALAGVCYFAVPRILLWRASRLLADVYSEVRPFPFRLPDHGYSAVKSGGLHHISQTLIRAVALLRWLEGIRPEDPEVHRLLGRASFLEGSLDEAVRDYGRSLELDPAGAGARLELAGVLLTRAGAQQRPADLALALEQAGRAEAFEAPSAVSSFNLALLYESLLAPNLAAGEWQHCLRLETTAAWRREAQSHRDRMTALLAGRAARMAALNGGPQRFLAASATKEYPVETALEPAIANWLPLRNQDPAAARALESVANRAMRLHHDPWLRDLLQLPRSDATAKAYAALAQAARANETGLHEQAAARAADARRMFQALASPAGELGARFQFVYAIERVGNQGCIAESQALSRDLTSTHYAWLTAQAWLEMSTCTVRTGETDQVAGEREKALEWIERTGYEGLALRARGFLIQPDLARANPIRMWRLLQQGLGRFWQSDFAPARAQQFYHGAALAARDSRLYFAATELAREGNKLLEESPNLRWRALCLSMQGSIELAAGWNAAASRSFARADAFYAQSADSETVRNYRLESSLLRADADAEVAARDPARVVELLAPLRQRSSGTTYRYAPVESLLGLAYLRQGRLEEARTCFRHVVDRTEQELAKASGQNQRDALLEGASVTFRGQIQLKLAVEKDPPGAFALWKQFRRLRSPSQRVGAAGELPKDVAALVIVELPEGTAVFAADHAGVEAKWLVGSGTALDAAAHRFTLLCGTEASAAAEIDRTGRALYAKLILPFERRLLGKRILAISAGGALGGMPWSALRDRHGRLLLEKQTIVLGSEFALGWDPASAAPERPPLVVAAPALAADLAGNFPPLGDELGEARRIVAAYPGARLLTGREATVKALKELLPHSAFFHFGGHGMTNGGYGAILLASEPGQAYGGVLGSPEIAGLDLHGVRLVSLASCSSGVGEWTGLVNPDSLVRALLDAGTRNVIAAPWNVDSAATGELFGDLYQRLHTIGSVAESLRRACLEIRSRRGTAHPYFWAGFQTYGVPD